MKKVFIDGSAGTTGLRIYDRLRTRSDIELITLSDDRRKDPQARKEALNSADVAFLCLPDDAAREAVSLADNPDTAIIDTSTAHRTDDNWVYGFPEIGNLRERIKNSKRIANPGCHASGFIALIAPLIQTGAISPEIKLSCTSLTGYSGGGKKMIAQYENNNSESRCEPCRGTAIQIIDNQASSEISDVLLSAPRAYGLSQAHKHLPEMKKLCGLIYEPVFCPIVSCYYSGMETVIPLFAVDINTDINGVKEIYRNYYKNGLVFYNENSDENGFLSAGALSGRDDMEISVFGNGERMILTARFDNLGKGASGAAIQNMNIILGLDESLGLCTPKGERI